MSNNGPKFGEGVGKAIGVATRVAEITPHDTNDNVPDGTRALLVGVGGLIDIVDLEGNAFTGIPVPAGIVPLSVKRVTTGSTASNIWALI